MQLLMHQTKYVERLCQESRYLHTPSMTRFRRSPHTTRISNINKSKYERLRLFEFDNEPDSDGGYYYSAKFEIENGTIKEVCKVHADYSPLSFKFISKFTKKRMHMIRDY